MKSLTVFFLMNCVLSLSGCASLFNGQSQTVRISTHPEAEIYVDNEFMGKGERTLNLQRDVAHQIKVSLGNCEQAFKTKRSFNKTALLGLFIDFGLVSIPLDFTTGAAWNIEPEQFHMQPACMKNSN